MGARHQQSPAHIGELPKIWPHELTTSSTEEEQQTREDVLVILLAMEKFFHIVLCMPIHSDHIRLASMTIIKGRWQPATPSNEAYIGNQFTIENLENYIRR